jgi:hypothetical protein
VPGVITENAMTSDEHPSQVSGKNTMESPLTTSPLHRIDAAARLWYVRYTVVIANIVSAFVGVVWFFWDVPHSLITGEYRSLLARLIWVIPAGLGVWIDGRRTYVSALKDLERMCRDVIPVFAARVGNALTAKLRRIERLED